MKKTLFSLVAVLALTVAGFAWAGQSAAPAPEVTEQPAEAVVPSSEAVVDAEVTLEALFVDPVEVVGACCFAQCMGEWDACRSACPPYGDPNRQACLAACQAQKESCQSNC